jgi:biotin transport system substrate-specific component
LRLLLFDNFLVSINHRFLKYYIPNCHVILILTYGRLLPKILLSFLWSCEMQIAGAIRETRLSIFSWRYHADLPLKITLAVSMAILTGLLAQVRLPLPFTPVPVTGQTLAVLLAGVMLGKKWGGMSMAIYGVLGFAGLPWFNGTTSGLGATAGYILGFVLAAGLVGHLTDGYLKARSFYGLLGVMLFASLVLVYVPGLLWLGGWMNIILYKPADVGSVIGMGALPFIAGDIIKAVAAAGIAWLILPKTPFGHEADPCLKK